MIDPRAVVDPKAEIAEDVEVGPFAVIGADVQIGAGTRVGPHVVIKGPARIGRDNRIFQFASLGDDPQDKKYDGERTLLEIGDRNTIREYVSVNRGTAQDAGVTRIGHDNWIMAYVHIAHDCILGNNLVMANGTSLAGHVRVDDYVSFGGFSLVHQFVHIGAHAFTGHSSALTGDVPPYIMVAGAERTRPYGVNVVGLKRRDFTAEQVDVIRKAYKILYRSGLRLEDAREALAELAEKEPVVTPMVEFLATTRRSVMR